MIINYKKIIPAIYQKCQEAIASGEDWQFMENKTTFALFKSELQEAFDATVLDFGGHNESSCSGITLADLSKGHSSGSIMLENIKERTTRALKYFVRDIYKAINQNQTYEEIEKSVLRKPSYFYIMPMLVEGTAGTYCFVCGRTIGYYMKDGVISAGCKLKEGTPEWDSLDDMDKTMLRGEADTLDSTCEYPNGIDQFEQYMTIKSNYLVFANDLRHVIKIDPIESMKYVSKRSSYHNTINSELGAIHDQEYSLNQGLLKVQVGNSSPVVAYNSKTGVILAAEPNAWEKKKKHTFPIDVTGFRSKGSICTDVWTVQAVDSIIFEAEAKEKEMTLEDVASKHGFLVPVKPGRYKITNYNAHHYANRPVFFSMEKVD